MQKRVSRARAANPLTLQYPLTQTTSVVPTFLASRSPLRLVMETPHRGQAQPSLRQMAGPADDSRIDAELLGRYVASHDGAAFSRLVERHGAMVLAVCRRE